MKILFDDNSYLEMTRKLSNVLITLASPDKIIKNSLKIQTVEISNHQFKELIKSVGEE